MNPEKQERIERVTELAARRFSAREIAELMHCTRNAIIGLCDRNGVMLQGGGDDRRAPRSPRIRAIPYTRSPEAKAKRLAAYKPHPRVVYKPSRILMWAGLV